MVMGYGLEKEKIWIIIVGTCFWWYICEAIFNGALSYKPIQEFYMIKTSQRELLLMCIVIVNSMLKALKHTHTS